LKLDAVCVSKKGECAIDIANAIQIPHMMIYIILKSAQEIETNGCLVVKPLEDENYMPKGAM
jgi:hypothetical protein